MEPYGRPGAQTATRLRCGTPDCDWGITISGLSEESMKNCYARFREHCIDRHGLGEADTDARIFFSLDEPSGRLPA